MSLYTSGWFKIEKLVDRNTFNTLGEQAWELFDDRLLITLDRLRVIYEGIWINNWDKGGECEWNGFWTPDCPFYNPYSQHVFGRAVNLKFENFPIDEIYNDIMRGRKLKQFEYITTVMKTDEYLHIDVRNGNRFTVLEP